MSLFEVLWVLLVLSWIYWLIALWLVHDFFDTQETVQPEFTPPISILKPVKGLDHESYQNFASFCLQEYPEFEVLFGVADPNDPAVHVVERLQREFPSHKIRLIKSPAGGPNRKASLLHHLETHATHEVLAVSDSDMRVTPDYLRRVVQPLADDGVGLVTCPYRGMEPLSLSARLEALHMDFTFLPNVVVARAVLRMKFALGASLILRREELKLAGGFAPLADYLADDYLLGVRIAEQGLQVHLSRYVIANILGVTSLREQWGREVRWSVTSRAVRPWGSLGLLLTFSTPLALILAWSTQYASTSLLALALSITLRWLVAWPIAGYVGDPNARRWLIWLPVRDVLSAIIWLVGLFTRHIVWRGQKFTVRPDGRMTYFHPPDIDTGLGQRAPERD